MNLARQYFKTDALTEIFGVEVYDFNLAEITRNDGFPELRSLFEEHSAILFRHQNLTDEAQLQLAKMFGPLEDRAAETRKPGEPVGVSPVSNITPDGDVTAEMDMHTLHLKANQLWHIDSTFMPTPAICNILKANVVTDVGGETEIASTRAAWAVMPESLKVRIRGKICSHNYTRSRETISKELAKSAMFNKWPPQRWPAIWVNPVNGKEALYIASHIFEVEGMQQSDGERLIDELMEYSTQPRFVYSHQWAVGDVLIWDQRAVMHRGRPWPYEQPRKLTSVCCSMVDSDGLADARREVGGIPDTISSPGKACDD